VLAIAARVAPFAREGSPTSGGLEIELTDGRRYASEIDQALGHPDRPMTDARLRGKFVDCATRAAVAMTVVEAQELCDRILSLELDVPIERALSLPSRADASRDFGRHSAN
jgi:2-methylcitrate dehydratase PrpD